MRHPIHLALPAAWSLLAVLAAGCQAQPAQRPGPATPAVPAAAAVADDDLLQRISAEVGEARCSSAADCRTLPIGHKACGGPAGWMAWSATASDGARLQALARDLAQRQRKRAEADGMVSTCSVVRDPGADCLAGRCVLVQRDPAR